MTKHPLIAQDTAYLKHNLIAWKKKQFLYNNVYTYIKYIHRPNHDENVVRKKQCNLYNRAST